MDKRYRTAAEFAVLRAELIGKIAYITGRTEKDIDDEARSLAEMGTFSYIEQLEDILKDAQNGRV